MNRRKHIEKIQVAAGTRTYFIEVNKSREGMLFLKLSESFRVDENRYKQRTILVFEEDIKAVTLALHKALKLFPDAVDILKEEERRIVKKSGEKERAESAV